MVRVHISFVSHMHPSFIKDVGCVTGVIEFLCRKTSAAVNDVKALKFRYKRNHSLRM